MYSHRCIQYTSDSHRWIQCTNDSHLKQSSDYRQATKSLPGASRPRRGQTTTNGTYSWQFRCINSIHIVLCTSNDLIHVYVVGIHVKRIITSCFTQHLLQSIGIFRLSSRILYAKNLTIIYCTANS